VVVQFIAGATDICQALQHDGYWADFIDPSSGRPVCLVCNSAVGWETVLKNYILIFLCIADKSESSPKMVT